MNTQALDLIDRVSANTGLHLPALAERLGLKERSLRRIRSGENELSEQVRLHLLDLERLAEGRDAKSRKPASQPASARISEEPAEYHPNNGDESMALVLRRITARLEVKEMATLITEIAGDEDLPQRLRMKVVKILSELIPERMK